MSWEAKYEGSCAECSDAIEPGDMMDTKDGKPVHADCKDEETFRPMSRGSSGGPSLSSLGGGTGRKQKICPKCNLTKEHGHVCWA